jgi:uncharacterized protein (TIGR00725 family)
MEIMKPVKVGVVGAGTCSKEIAKTAYAVGRGIAVRKALLVCGGLGGVMEAAAKGAKEAGGITVGILPGDNDADANPYISIPIATGMGHARNTLVVKASNVLIAVSGSYGTLSEIALALKMGKDVVGLHTWSTIAGVQNAETAEEAVEKAFNLLSHS